MSDEERRPTPPAISALAKSLGQDGDSWYHQCHRAAVALVTSGFYGPDARVARGTCTAVGGQHSWVVVPPSDTDEWRLSIEGGLVYHPDARIVDPTRWSYDSSVDGIWEGPNLGEYRPHGHGDIWEWARPADTYITGEDEIELTPATPLSAGALGFLDMCGPLGRRGWSDLVHSPMGGWPSSEIVAAVDDTPGMSAIIPIDILAHVTNRVNGYFYAGQ